MFACSLHQITCTRKEFWNLKTCAGFLGFLVYLESMSPGAKSQWALQKGNLLFFLFSFSLHVIPIGYPVGTHRLSWDFLLERIVQLLWSVKPKGAVFYGNPGHAWLCFTGPLLPQSLCAHALPYTKCIVERFSHGIHYGGIWSGLVLKCKSLTQFPSAPNSIWMSL